MQSTDKTTPEKSKNCASDRIKDVILQRICDGTYQPGQKLVELQIAKEFATSQAPIREALSQLEAMRVVETQPYKGTRVREVTSREMQECLEIRGVLEQLAAEKMGERLKPRMDELRQKAMETVAAAREKNAQKYGFANIEFHRIIVEASANDTLMMVWQTIAPEIRMLSLAHANLINLEECANEHLEIIEAFAESDNRYAGKLLKLHTETVLVGVDTPTT
ncbi:MAG: GntR family transcriptional regulator [Cyanobacteria bacterium SZAS-4]|nr:GntR family transcriptional regulator [Cyanobacteria bacterium SZAS-4]